MAAAWTQERKLQRRKEHPLSLLACPLVASLKGTLRVSEKRRHKVYAQEKEGHRPPRRTHAASLSKFHLFSWAQERASFLLDCPIFFWLFPGSVVSSPYPISFLDFPGACSLTLFLFPGFDLPILCSSF